MEEVSWTAGELLRIQRGQLGLTLQQVAAAAGTTRQAVASWESGRSQPSTRRLAALFAALQFNNAQRRLVVAAWGGNGQT